jgi:hypothetical protein
MSFWLCICNQDGHARCTGGWCGLTCCSKTALAVLPLQGGQAAAMTDDVTISLVVHVADCMLTCRAQA